MRPEYSTFDVVSIWDLRPEFALDVSMFFPFISRHAVNLDRLSRSVSPDFSLCAFSHAVWSRRNLLLFDYRHNNYKHTAMSPLTHVYVAVRNLCLDQLLSLRGVLIKVPPPSILCLLISVKVLLCQPRADQPIIFGVSSTINTFFPPEVPFHHHFCRLSICSCGFPAKTLQVITASL